MSLCNGAEIPVLGFGTAKCDDVYTAICTAIDAGYRHLDTAYVYHNEAEIGRALGDKIRAGVITREDLWITTKLWNSYHRSEQVEECLQRSLIALGVDYVDLYLVHWPIAFREGHEGLPQDGPPITTDVDYIDTWRGMEEVYMEGKARNIGVSNFNSEQIDRLLVNCDIRPLVNQVEANVHLNQEKLRSFCGQRGVSLTAYSPLGSPGYKRWPTPCSNQNGPKPLENPVVASLALKYSKTPAQILLRFLIQRGISSIPKSSAAERIKENIDVFDFNIDPEDMRQLMALDLGYRRFCADNLREHKFYPFATEF
ncbi:1,5-anhydro-D-fructose reductase [Galendromus occidentalis]|uniref:1,5-anhydro-D-fructose reductase n=1 Tax=Galendromus occidentalis TaxID=34638 RepID=A0AAJ7SEU0_9ACAR|nr:1,5-anhydro-D-fructose reductase [Galendromus occidentalis]